MTVYIDDVYVAFFPLPPLVIIIVVIYYSLISKTNCPRWLFQPLNFTSPSLSLSDSVYNLFVSILPYYASLQEITISQNRESAKFIITANKLFAVILESHNIEVNSCCCRYKIMVNTKSSISIDQSKHVLDRHLNTKKNNFQLELR